MCFGIPVKVVEIDGLVAQCEARGVRREVNISMIQDGQVTTDDFVVVHLDHAIQKISQQDAETAWELYDQMLNAEQGISGI